MLHVGAIRVGVWVVVVDGIVAFVVNCVGIDRCTGKKRFQRLNFVQAVNTAVPTELWFKDCFFPKLA